MEDLKKIQEFFSKPLEESKQLDQVDFAKVVQAVTKTGHPVTVLLVPKFNEIEVITGMNAPDDMLFDLSNAVDGLGYGYNVIIAGDSSNLSRREYSDIRRVNGGAKDYFEESVNEIKVDYDFSERELKRVLKLLGRGASTEIKMIKAFEKALGRELTKDELFETTEESVKENSHFEKRLAKMAAAEKEKREKNPKYAAASKLDVDVEDFFEKGQSYQEFKKRLDKLKEYNSGIYYDPAKDNPTGNPLKAKEASKTGLEKVRDMIKKIMTENEGEDQIDTITMDVPLFIRILEYAREDAQDDMDLHDLAEKAIAGTKQQGMLSMDDYDMLVGDLEQITMNEEEGYSQYLKDDPEHPDGKTKGLDTRTMNKILMRVIQDLDEKKKPGLWANIHAKRERGEEPSHGNSKAHKSAVAAGKRINKEK